MGLRAQICSQCRPVPSGADPLQRLAAHVCENNCAMFIQLPRLARFLDRHRPIPPAGYEEFALKLLSDAAADISHSDPEALPGPFLDYSDEALAILERIVALSEVPVIAAPSHDCARQSFAMAQVSVHGVKSDSAGPSAQDPKGHS